MNPHLDIELREHISISAFREFLFYHIVPLEDLQDFEGKPLRNLMPYWRKHGLVPFIEKGKWVKISFAELIWLRILDSLRSFSFPMEKMKNLVKYFFFDAYDDNLPRRILEYNKWELEKIKLARPLDMEEKFMLSRLEEMEQNEELMYSAKLDVNYLSQLLVRSLSEGERASILVFSNGQVVEKFGKEYQTHRAFLPDLKRPFIELSLTHYLEEFIESEELSYHFLPRILSSVEEKVIKVMRDRKVRLITIHMYNGEVKKIESKKSMTFTEDQWLEIKKILGIKNYEKIEIDTIDKKNFSVLKTNKKL